MIYRYTSCLPKKYLYIIACPLMVIKVYFIPVLIRLIDISNTSKFHFIALLEIFSSSQFQPIMISVNFFYPSNSICFYPSITLHPHYFLITIP